MMRHGWAVAKRQAGGALGSVRWAEGAEGDKKKNSVAHKQERKQKKKTGARRRSDDDDAKCGTGWDTCTPRGTVCRGHAAA